MCCDTWSSNLTAGPESHRWVHLICLSRQCFFICLPLYVFTDHHGTCSGPVMCVGYPLAPVTFSAALWSQYDYSLHFSGEQPELEKSVKSVQVQRHTPERIAWLPCFMKQDLPAELPLKAWALRNHTSLLSKLPPSLRALGPHTSYSNSFSFSLFTCKMSFTKKLSRWNLWNKFHTKSPRAAPEKHTPTVIELGNELGFAGFLSFVCLPSSCTGKQFGMNRRATWLHHTRFLCSPPTGLFL